MLTRSRGTPARIRLGDFVQAQELTGVALDLGSGRRPYSSSLEGLVAIAVDIDPSFDVDVRADAHQLPFRRDAFDVVLCTELLEHVKDPQSVVNEIHRVTRTGGTCVLSTRFGFPIHGAPHDYFRFTRYGLLHLFGAWCVRDLVPDGGTAFTVATAVHYRISGLGRRQRRVARVLWTPLWRILQVRAGRRPSRLNDLFPPGYHLLAEKRD